MTFPSLRFIEPPEFTDEHIAQLLEFLNALAAALESHYGDQLHRYYQSLQSYPPEPDLFDDLGDDPPAF